MLIAFPFSKLEHMKCLLLATLGNVEHQLKLANDYWLARGVEVDKNKAFKWCERAAHTDYPEAQYLLAIFYLTGTGTTENKKQAFKYYELSALQGFADAEHALGWCYEQGVGIEKSLEQSVFWWKKSASKDIAESQLGLACSYIFGNGLEIDTAKGKELYYLALKNGADVSNKLQSKIDLKLNNE